MEVAGANRRWPLQFRCRGSRRESAVAPSSLRYAATSQLSTLAAFTLMKSKRIRKLQAWTIIVSLVYTLLAVFVHEFVNYTDPGYLMIESEANTDSMIQRQDLQSSRINLKVALGKLDTLRHSKYELQLIFLLAIISIVGFNGWSLYMIRRIKREDLHDHAA